MPAIVTAHEVEAILTQWHSGALRAEDVHGWAEARFCTDWDSESEAINEVLGHLDRMNMNLVMAADIPLLREALLAESAENASSLIERSYLVISIEARKRLCASEPFYAPFCK